MKRRIIPVLVVIVLLLLIAGGAVAARYLERYIPSKEMADVREALEVPDGGTAFFYNDERLQDVDAVVRDGQAYLPLAWVNETLNEKFYWDDVEKLLVYTLPDTVVYADKRTMGSGGSRRIWRVRFQYCRFWRYFRRHLRGSFRGQEPHRRQERPDKRGESAHQRQGDLRGSGIRYGEGDRADGQGGM